MPACTQEIPFSEGAGSTSPFNSEIWCFNVSWSGGKFLLGGPLAGGQQLGLSLLGPRDPRGWDRQSQRGFLGPEVTTMGPQHRGPGGRAGWAGSDRGPAGAVVASCSGGLYVMVMMGIEPRVPETPYPHCCLGRRPRPFCLGIPGPPPDPDLEGHWAQDGCPAPPQGSVLAMGSPAPVLCACLGSTLPPGCVRGA